MYKCPLVNAKKQLAVLLSYPVKLVVFVINFILRRQRTRDSLEMERVSDGVKNVRQQIQLSKLIRDGQTGEKGRRGA